MDLQSIKGSLRQELKKTENQELFEMARARNTALANHSTPFSVLAALESRTTAGYVEKEALTRALIEEQQRAPSSLWSTILVTAYLPMLDHLRNRMTTNPLLAEDLDHVVITTFLEVVQSFPLPRWQSYTCVRLRQQTKRRVLREINRQRLDPKFWDFRSLADIPDDEMVGTSFWDLARTDRRNSRDVEDEIELLRDCVGDAIEPDKLDVVIMTSLKGQSLRDFIRNRRPACSSRSGEREYQRVKRERTRTLAYIRKILTRKMSPTPGD